MSDDVYDDPGRPLRDLLACTGVLDPAVPTEHIVTHGAVIVLNGERAWKMKRPVSYRYMDFSTIELRRRTLADEYTLNVRTAPQIYRALHAITRCDDGVELDGTGEPVDYVLEMVRFPDEALAGHLADAGMLDDRLLGALADGIADMHRGTAISEDPAGADRLLDVIVGNLASMSRFPEILDPIRASALTARLETLIDEHRVLLDLRARSGRVRRGHGDLHLRNLVVLDGTPVPFDCLEFDAELATVDVLYDLAFLLMDLWGRGLRHEANAVANAYLDASAEDEEGYVLLPLMMSVRATVRAHVAAAAGDVDDAHANLALAETLLDPAPPRLIAIGGASGTGKSTVARSIAADLGCAPGARILRSDVLRKRLAGVPVHEHLPASGYTRAATAAVYAELGRIAADDLAGGMTVIADAVSGTDAQRDALQKLAAQHRAEFRGYWLELPEAERIARIAARGPDASDATADVARAQTRRLTPPGAAWQRVDASGDFPPVR